MSETVQQDEVVVNLNPVGQSALVKQIPSITSQMAAIKISNQETLDAAVELKRFARAWVEKWDALFNPIREAAHKTWKTACRIQDDGKAQVEQGVKTLGQRIDSYIIEERRKAEEAQRKLDAEQARINKKAAEDAAKQAKKAGADPEAIKEVKEAVLATPAPVVAPKAAAPKDYSVRILYNAECVSLRKLVKAAADDDSLLGLLQVNQTALRNRAIEQKDAFKIPGCELRKTTSGSDRGS